MNVFRGFYGIIVALAEIVLLSLMLSGCVPHNRLITTDSVENDRYIKVYEYVSLDNSVRDFWGVNMDSFHVEISAKTKFVRYVDFYRQIARNTGLGNGIEREVRDSLLQIDSIRLRNFRSVNISDKILSCCSRKDSDLILIFSSSYKGTVGVMLVYDENDLWEDFGIVDGDFLGYLFSFDQSSNIEDVFVIKGSATG